MFKIKSNVELFECQEPHIYKASPSEIGSMP